MRQAPIIGDGHNAYLFFCFVNLIDDIEVANGKLSALQGRKHGIFRKRIPHRHFGQAFYFRKDSSRYALRTNWIAIRKRDDIRDFCNVTFSGFSDFHSKDHTPAFAGTYLDVTRWRTAASGAVRPALASMIPRIAFAAISSLSISSENERLSMHLVSVVFFMTQLFYHNFILTAI